MFAGLALLGVLTLACSRASSSPQASRSSTSSGASAAPPWCGSPAIRSAARGAAADRHPDWELPDGVVVVRYEGPLFYPNAVYAKDQTIALGAGARRIVLDLSSSADLDVSGIDALGELAAAVPELWVAAPHAPVRKRIRAARLRGSDAPRADDRRRDHPDGVIPVHPCGGDHAAWRRLETQWTSTRSESGAG